MTRRQSGGLVGGLILVVFAVGCQSEKPKQAVVEPRAEKPVKVTPRLYEPPPSHKVPPTQTSGRVVVRKQVVGRSVQGKPIERLAFGNGPRPTLIFAGIHGDEVSSVALARNFIDDLMNHPIDFGRHPVVIIPVANPDGYALNRRENVRGVDCNRNFPARNWKPMKGKRSGARPLSEPEADAVYRVVEQYQPRQIISIHSIRGERYCNNYDGPARDLAELMNRYNGYPAQANIGYPTPGSFGSWAGVDLGYPVITLELPRGIDAKSAWTRNREALRAAVQHVPQGNGVLAQ